jgi:hypothetical protein
MSIPRYDPVPDGIDTLVQRVQATDRHPMLDLILTHPKLGQLTPTNHPVLPARKLRQQPIASATPRMTGTIPGYDELAGHAWGGCPETSHVWRAICAS